MGTAPAHLSRTAMPPAPAPTPIVKPAVVPEGLPGEPFGPPATLRRSSSATDLVLSPVGLSIQPPAAGQDMGACDWHGSEEAPFGETDDMGMGMGMFMSPMADFMGMALTPQQQQQQQQQQQEQQEQQQIKEEQNETPK